MPPTHRYTLLIRADPDVVTSFHIACNQPPASNTKAVLTYTKARETLIHALDSVNEMDRYIYGLARVSGYANLGDREGGYNVLFSIAGPAYENDFFTFYREAIPHPCRSFVDITPQTLAGVAIATAAFLHPTPRLSVRVARFYLSQLAIAGVPHAIVSRGLLVYDDSTRADFAANKEFACAGAIGYPPAVVLDWRSHVYPSRVCSPVPNIHDLWNAIDHSNNQGDILFPFNFGCLNSMLEIAGYAYMGTNMRAAVAVYRRLADIGYTPALRWYARCELIQMCFPEPTSVSGPMSHIWPLIIKYASEWKRTIENGPIADRIFSYIKTYVDVTAEVNPLFVICLRYGIGTPVDRATARHYAHNNCLDEVFGRCYALWSRLDRKRYITLSRYPNLSPTLRRHNEVSPGCSDYYDITHPDGIVAYRDPYEAVLSDDFDRMPAVVSHDAMPMGEGHEMCVVCIHRKRSKIVATDGYFAFPKIKPAEPARVATLRSHYLNWQCPITPPPQQCQESTHSVSSTRSTGTTV